ncbi:glycosyltransferase [Streptomyces sp. TRM49041]|uniref:glycosyltransferase n=1 Tax=Streptomyces sp. TRM49041 TaxID=2603216 RepID=UPI0011EE8107|nr:glycosyltransferase [Streptomyces sp. TRM49041]
MAADGRRPRVLLLTSGPLDGRQGADTQLATALAQTVPDTEFLWFGQQPRGLPIGQTSGRRLPIVSRHGVPDLPVRLQSAAVGALAARRADLVHVVMTIGSGFPSFSRLWPRLVGRRPVLHTVPGVMDPALLTRCRPLGPTVALSEVTAGALRAAGFHDVRIIRPLVRLDHWPRRPRPDTSPPTVLIVAHHDPEGGAEDAIKSAAVAARAGARFHPVLAVRARPGQNARLLEAGLRAHAENEGLYDIEILGHVPDMHGLIVSSDVLLFVPRALGGKADVPLTVLEALATGRPVILSDLPQFASLRDTVLRAPAGDCHRTGHLLRQLLERPWWWENLAERGRATVEDRFGPDRFRADYERLYQELLT